MRKKPQITAFMGLRVMMPYIKEAIHTANPKRKQPKEWYRI